MGPQVIIAMIEPVAKQRPRLGRNCVYTPYKTRLFEKRLSAIIKSQFKYAPIKTGVDLDIVVFVSRPKSVKRDVTFCTKRPDIDNYLKAILDAANGILFVDDNQVCSVRIKKMYSDEPRITIVVQDIS